MLEFGAEFQNMHAFFMKKKWVKAKQNNVHLKANYW